MAQRWYQKATVQLGLVTLVGSVLVALTYVFFGPSGDSIKVGPSIQESPDAKQLITVNSPNTTQLVIENLTINLSPQLERKLAMKPVYVNSLQGDSYVTLLRGRLTAPYPIPNLRIEAHGETVEDLQFTGTGIYELSDRGKNQGYVFATWQDAIGNLELKIISRQAGKLDIRFAVQE
jgi:hypothetical protein